MSVSCDRSVVFSVYSSDKTDRHDITEILLKEALDIITHNIYISAKHNNLMQYCTDFWRWIIWLFMASLHWIVDNRKLVQQNTFFYWNTNSTNRILEHSTKVIIFKENKFLSLCCILKISNVIALKKLVIEGQFFK